MKRYLILVAGGKGERMRDAVPKQFMEVCGKPLIMHTLDAFSKSGLDPEIILVLPEQHFENWKSLCSRHHFDLPHQIAGGGPTRFHSVKSGLKLVCSDPCLVAIHDAVRPLVSPELIRRVYADAELHGNAVPCISVQESLRERSGTISRAVKREHFVIVQTPQCFREDLIRRAYLQTYREEFTDDAGVFESDGGQIRLVAGEVHNIKITTPPDLQLFELLLKA